MVNSEFANFLVIIKTKDIVNLMKTAFLDESTPVLMKESLAYSISSFRVIIDKYDQCFSLILNLLLNRLKEEEKHWSQQPYNKELDPRRCKYGIRTLATILNALSIICLGNDGLKQEIADHGGIEIGLRYLNHPSAKIRVMAALLFGLSRERMIGYNFRKNNYCIPIFNSSIPPPLLNIITSSDSNITSPTQHLQHLHSGMIQGIGLCLNCDLQIPSEQNNEYIDMEQRKISNQCFDLFRFIQNQPSTANILCQHMNTRIENENAIEIQSINQTQNLNKQIKLINYTDLLSKIILYLHHPCYYTRSSSLSIIQNVYFYGEKEWIINETKEYQKRKLIKELEQQNKHKIGQEKCKIEVKIRTKQLKCKLCALPAILSFFHQQQNDQSVGWLLNVFSELLNRLIKFRNEEQQELIQKMAQNLTKEEQIVQIDEQASDNENNSSYPAIKRVHEDLEEEGLIENIQSNLFSKINYRYSNVKTFFCEYQNVQRL